MTEQHQGGCLCGAVRYTIDGPPAAVAVCHCTNCRKQGGSAFSVNCVVPDAAFHRTGETQVFTDRGDSGNAVWRHFCPACGSPIVSIVETMPGITIVKAGTLDAPDTFAPVVEVYCASAVAWVPAMTQARFERNAG